MQTVQSAGWSRLRDVPFVFLGEALQPVLAQLDAQEEVAPLARKEEEEVGAVEREREDHEAHRPDLAAISPDSRVRASGKLRRGPKVSGEATRRELESLGWALTPAPHGCRRSVGEA